MPDHIAFHETCGHQLECEWAAETPEESWWYCPHCDQHTNEIKTPQ